MSKQQQVQKKNPSHSPDVSNTANFLQRRPFVQVSDSSKKLQTQLETANNLGHNFSQVQVQPKSSVIVQPKLTIGEPGDKYEQEADRVAAEVVQKLHSPQPAQVQKEESEEGNQIQTKPIYPRIQRMNSVVQRKLNLGGGTASSEFESSLNSARSGGQPLQPQLRMKIEDAMGTDFSGVRVHTDAKADQLNRSVQARAFTTGKDVFFKKGEYSPGNRGGQELIAHELTHVVQQNSGAVRRSLLLD